MPPTLTTEEVFDLPNKHGAGNAEATVLHAEALALYRAHHEHDGRKRAVDSLYASVGPFHADYRGCLA